MKILSHLYPFILVVGLGKEIQSPKLVDDVLDCIADAGSHPAISTLRSPALLESY